MHTSHQTDKHEKRNGFMVSWYVQILGYCLKKMAVNSWQCNQSFPFEYVDQELVYYTGIFS